MMYCDYIIELLNTINRQEEEHVKKAAKCIVNSIEKGGIIQSFGSGHSYAAAVELVERAGGYFAAKLIKDPAMGLYESVEGIGTILSTKLEVLPEDVVFIISHSGRNPMTIELAQYIKSKGATLIVVTALEASKKLVSRHSSGKLLYQLADVVLNTHAPEGDAAFMLDGMDVKVCPVSTIPSATLIQSTVLLSIQMLLEKGVKPDIRMSANLDGGLERSLKMQKKYNHRILHQ